MPSIKRVAARYLNSWLSTAGLKLDIVSNDLASAPLDNYAQTKMASEMASLLSEWLEVQSIFAVAGDKVTSKDVQSFFWAWKETPFVLAGGSSRFNNLCALFAISKAFQPTVIVDSGSYQGASAWALKQGCPSAKVLSFDIDLSALLHKEPDVIFRQSDWADSNLDLSGERSLLYFDDHVDQIKRLIESKNAGGDLAIFDDDFNVYSFARMAPSVDVLPKIEFALDEALPDGHELVWKYRGKKMKFHVAQNYLEEGRSAIETTDRVVDTSIVTGIQQTPYRVVKIAKD